jgi:hypothetical protein
MRCKLLFCQLLIRSLTEGNANYSWSALRYQSCMTDNWFCFGFQMTGSNYWYLDFGFVAVVDLFVVVTG